MPTTYYCSVGGRTHSQVSGGVRRDFLTDAIGSVTATINEHGNIENTYRYKPYGGTLAKTGTGADPRLGWRGSWNWLSSRLQAIDFECNDEYYDSAAAIWPATNPTGFSETSVIPFLGCPTSAFTGRGQPQDVGAGGIGPRPNPGLTEHYARVRTTFPNVREIVGFVTLPQFCDTQQGQWYNFYLPFAEGPGSRDGSLADCSASLICYDKPGRPAGWSGSLRMNGGPMQYFPCPECSHGATIRIRMQVSKNGIITCSVGSGQSHPVSATFDTTQMFGQMAMGADALTPSRHSIARFSNVTVNPGKWTSRSATKPQTQGTYTSDGVNQIFPLAAHLGSTDNVCGCPTVEEGPPLPVVTHSPFARSKKC